MADEATTLLCVDDSAYPTVSIELDAQEASKVAEVLLHLAALIDPDDPDARWTAVTGDIPLGIQLVGFWVTLPVALILLALAKRLSSRGAIQRAGGSP